MDLFSSLFQLLVVSFFVHAQHNPSILQDTRNEPKLDGTFGFLYRTEDGISHAAKGEPGGHVVGRFTYTDPTGLKVNFNYNAGSGVTPKYNYNSAPVYQQRPAPPQPPQPPPQQLPIANNFQLQHSFANPNLPEDDGSYHPELDAQYEYHDSDYVSNNYLQPTFGK